MASLRAQIHITGHFYLIWQIVDILENLLMISLLVLLHVCYLFLKCFSSVWFSLAFSECRFSSILQIQQFLGSAMNFLLYCWCVNSYFGILSVMKSTPWRPSSTSCAYFSKSKEKTSASADEMQRAFTRISNWQMTYCRLAGYFSNPASIASASLVHLTHWI